MKRILLILIIHISILLSQENRLFWDGRDWNRISKNVEYNPELTFRIKTAYLNGVLDGRLLGYLKTWTYDEYLADQAFGETVDYLTPRELVKNLDHFYKDPVNGYIPIPSAIIISNMYAERIPIELIDKYILETKSWINNLSLNLDDLDYSKLLEDKYIKHYKKKINQSE